MSFEGFYELICANGHYSGHDCYEARPKKCQCGEPWKFYRLVDQTNSEEKGNPSTMPAKLRHENGKTWPANKKQWHTA